MVFVLRQIQEKCREQNMGLFVAFIHLTKDFDTVSREGPWKILARLGCHPKFLTILRQLHEGQMSQVKHNGALSDSLPIANGVKQGCVLAPTLFSILFSLMLREAKEGLMDHIFIRFRTDGSIFNLRRLLAHTKTIEVLIVELLFADDCALLTHTQEALQHIVKRFAEAAKAFGFTISLKKTEVLHQSPPGGVYSPPKINIEGTSLNSVEHFTYLGSVISNDVTVNKDLDKRLTRASSSFGRLHKRVWQNHSLRLSTKIQVYRAVVVPTLLYGCATWVLYRKQIRLLKRFHQRCLRSIMGIKWQEYVTNEEALKRASLPSLECTLLQQQLRWAPQRSRFTVQLWSLPYCTAARHGCCTASRSGCWSDFINAACVPSWGSSGRSTSPTRRPSSEPACQVLSVHYYSSSSVGLAMWPEWKTQGCPKLSSSASCGKANANVELQRSDTKTS